MIRFTQKLKEYMVCYKFFFILLLYVVIPCYITVGAESELSQEDMEVLLRKAYDKLSPEQKKLRKYRRHRARAIGGDPSEEVSGQYWFQRKYFDLKYEIDKLNVLSAQVEHLFDLQRQASVLFTEDASMQAFAAKFGAEKATPYRISIWLFLLKKNDELVRNLEMRLLARQEDLPEFTSLQHEIAEALEQRKELAKALREAVGTQENADNYLLPLCSLIMSTPEQQTMVFEVLQDRWSDRPVSFSELEAAQLADYRQALLKLKAALAGLEPSPEAIADLLVLQERWDELLKQYDSVLSKPELKNFTRTHKIWMLLAFQEVNNDIFRTTKEGKRPSVLIGEPIDKLPPARKNSVLLFRKLETETRNLFYDLNDAEDYLAPIFWIAENGTTQVAVDYVFIDRVFEEELLKSLE